jgi:hypothetical protein
MAKAGMARPNYHDRRKNDMRPVPELQGKAKHTKKKAGPALYRDENGAYRSL